MEVLNMLKNTVANVLPGNPITREIDVGNHRASAGSGLLWKIYDGITRNTRQEVSVFFFEKKSVEKYSKREREYIVEVLKKGVSQLTRLRHPKILSVLHPLEESRESLAFATEPVFASLANVLGQVDNLPNPVPAEIKDYKLFDVEIKYGLLQVIEGLAFLHNDARLMHGNVCPESIVFNRSGAWKLAGFDFSISGTVSSEHSKPFFPHREYESELPPIIQPSLNYLAPEYALTSACDTASDMYAVGMVFFAVCNNGRTLYDCHGQYGTFKRTVSDMRGVRPGQLESVPSEVREHVQLLLNAEPGLRPDAHQLSKVPFFDDLGAKTLQYLDSLFQQDNLQKSQFFKGLPQVIAVLPKRVNLYRVLPCLVKESVNPHMVPFILPSLLLIVEQASDNEYTRFLLPELIPLFRIQDPIQVTYIFMQNMNLLLSKTPQADVRNHVLPMVYRALETDMPQMQEICLSILPTFAQLVEYTSLKNAVVPRIRKVCLSTTSLQLRVNCLICLGKLLEFMDKWFVLDDIFPFLPEITSREPAVLMSILGIYKVTLTHKKLGITKEVLATKVLPFLIPLSTDNNLNLNQFNAFATTIRDMWSRVETEQQAKLEQLNSMQQEQRSLQFLSEPVQSVRSLVPGMETPKQDSMMDEFMSSFGFKTVAAGSGGSTMATSSAGKAIKDAPTELTLEEKQRLAQSQGEQQRLKTQLATSIQPSSPASAASTASRPSPAPTDSAAKANKPKDLSSSLLANDMISARQLSQLTNGSSTAGVTSPVNQSVGGVMSPVNQSMGGISSPISQPMGGMRPAGPVGSSYSGSMQQMRGPSGGTMSGAPMFMSQPPYGGAASNASASFASHLMTSTAPSAGPMGQSQTQTSINLSAFDNLNPFGGPSPRQQSVPMRPTGSQPMGGAGALPPLRQPMAFGQPMMGGGNSMIGSQQPGLYANTGVMRPTMTPLAPSGEPQSGTKLSSKEIADLLG